MEEIMCEELSSFLGAKWGESTPERKGYRNGFYTRDLMTDTIPSCVYLSPFYHNRGQ